MNYFYLGICLFVETTTACMVCGIRFFLRSRYTASQALFSIWIIRKHLLISDKALHKKMT